MFEFKDAKSLKMPKIETGYNYENPVVLMARDIQNRLVEDEENKITCVIEQEIGVKVDKEHLIKALQFDEYQYKKGFFDGQKAAQNKWIAITTEAITDEERAECDYPEWVTEKYSCPLPDNDEQEVLVTTKWGEVTEIMFCREADACWFDGYDSGEIIAWMPKPEPYKAKGKENDAE